MMKFLLSFVYHYPLFMAFVWTVGAVVYKLRRTHGFGKSAVPVLKEHPMISVLVPCHNEGAVVRETMHQLSQLDYPCYEVIAINDGSTDNTGDVLEECRHKHNMLRVVTLATNQGKAVALKAGTICSNSEYVVCVDADAFLGKEALRYIVWHFISSPRVGAVTGNPRIRNRSSLLGKIQVGEYSTIVGMIKRTQRVLGKVFTVSGVVAAFRKRALLDVGFWDDDMVTEDIAISWKLQTRFWDIRYEERALCWILTPETLGGLWKQRLRWAQGGAEVIMKYSHSLLDYRERRMWPVCLEYAVSIAWTFSFFAVVVVAFLNIFLDLPEPYSMATIMPPEWAGSLLACVCLFQASVALSFEHHIEKGIGKYLFWFIWFPVVYWVIGASAAFVGLPMAIFKKRGTRAVWESPDRGIQ
jgi:biofilm PGA synthesis N-glycosyltransferase PgaC